MIIERSAVGTPERPIGGIVVTSGVQGVQVFADLAEGLEVVITPRCRVDPADGTAPSPVGIGELTTVLSFGKVDKTMGVRVVFLKAKADDSVGCPGVPVSIVVRIHHIPPPMT